MSPEFWRKRRVVVTGGTGFLGSRVTAKLRERGAQQVFVPRSRDYDLRDNDAVARMLADARPQLLIHLAAVVGGIGANRANPGRYLYENALMGIQIIEEARKAAVEKTLVVGTICSYPKYASVPFNEDDLWNGYPEETNAPYGVAKKLLLVQGQAYRQQYGMNVIHPLLVNLYGPGDDFELESSHVIAALLRKFVEARDADRSYVEAWGTGTQTREFLYVDDAAEGLLLAMERYDKPEPVNLGSGQEVSIHDLAHMIRETVGYKGELRWDRSKPDGQPRRRLDTSRARKEFGFEASTPLADGIRKTAEWYERSLSKVGL